MVARIFYLAKLFIVFLLFFFLQKVLFIYSNGTASAGELFQVLRHGLGLDMSTTGYLLILPFIVIWASIWVRLNPRTILRPYFILIAILLSVI